MAAYERADSQSTLSAGKRSLGSNREPVHEIKKALDCGLYADEGVAMLSINEEWASADRPSYWLHYDHHLCFNGRKVSAETRKLHDLRIRDFVSVQKIEKSDRNV